MGATRPPAAQDGGRERERELLGQFGLDLLINSQRPIYSPAVHYLSVEQQRINIGPVDDQRATMG